MLPLAASKGQKAGGVPLGEEERGTLSELVSHPNTKLQREWQWARMTTACTSSASDQHCSPSSVWKQQRQDEGPSSSGHPHTHSGLSYLDVGAGSEPGLMSQHLVNVVEETQARGRGLQPVQPQRVPAHPQKMSRVEVDQVVTVISRRSLKVRERDVRRRVAGAQGDVWRAFTDHDGDVMAIWQREGAVHVQDVVLCAQKALQVLRVRGHLLGHGVHAAGADQSLGQEQRHAFLLSIHHHLDGAEGRLEGKTATAASVREVSLDWTPGAGIQTTLPVSPCTPQPTRVLSTTADTTASMRISFSEMKVNPVNSCEMEKNTP